MAVDLSGDDVLVEAYKSTVELVGKRLIVGAQGMGKLATGSAERVIPLYSLQSIFLKDASRLINGQLELVTDRGKTIVHFRRKQQEAISGLYQAVLDAAPSDLRVEQSDAPLDSGKDPWDPSNEREELETALELVQNFSPIDAAEAAGDGIMLKRGEQLYMVIEDAALIEVRHAKGEFRGSMQGVSIRIAKGVSYRVGAGRGGYVPGPESPTPLDTGTVIVTDQRVVFRGKRESREWKFTNLTGVQHSAHRLWTALPVTNRQKTSGIGYGEGIADAVHLHLEIALADYHGSRDHLQARIEGALSDVNAAI